MKKFEDPLTGLTIIETEKSKIFRSKYYNRYFRKSDGFTLTFGKTIDDDPEFSPYPEILDLEISTGKCAGGCAFCYKIENGHTEVERHMTLDTVKKILDRFQYGDINVIDQTALGLTDTFSNPDFWEILQEFNNRSVSVNLTTHGRDITPENAKQLAKYCGAIAVSYHNRDTCYNAVKCLTDAGMTQINIHFVLYKGREKLARQIVDDILTDERLSKLNAIVWLNLKKKGKACHSFENLSFEEFSSLMDYCQEKKICYGMDSCSGCSFLKYIKGQSNEKQLTEMVSPCCAARQSSYISVNSEYAPCSFLQNSSEDGWTTGINVLHYDKIDKVWNHPRVRQYRKYVIEKSPAPPCSFLNKE